MLELLRMVNCAWEYLCALPLYWEKAHMSCSRFLWIFFALQVTFAESGIESWGFGGQWRRHPFLHWGFGFVWWSGASTRRQRECHVWRRRWNCLGGGRGRVWCRFGFICYAPDFSLIIQLIFSCNNYQAFLITIRNYYRITSSFSHSENKEIDQKLHTSNAITNFSFYKDLNWLIFLQF